MPAQRRGHEQLLAPDAQRAGSAADISGGGAAGASPTALAQFDDLQRIYWHDNTVYSVPVSEKVVALTFDDGPDPRFTPRVLALLRQYHIHAPSS